MEVIMGIFNWFKGNWADVANGIAYAIAIASLIVKLTPTLKDDTVLLAIIKFIGKYIALNVNTPNTQDRPQ